MVRTLALFCLVVLLGCSPRATSAPQEPRVRSEATTVMQRLATAGVSFATPADPKPEPTARPTAVATPTPVPVAADRPPPDIEAEARALRGAVEGPLRAGRWNEVSAQLCAEVYLVTSQGQQQLPRAQVVAWLQERWQPSVAITELSPMAHYAAIGLRTGGWRSLPPSGSGLTLVAHLVDADCRFSIAGQWRIDVITAE
jgi:hypothetical protein